MQRTLKQRFNGRHFGKHARIESAPEQEVTGKPVVGGIRDPHSWYLSLWQFGCSQKGINWMSSTSPVVQGILPQNVNSRLRSSAVPHTEANYARHIECETRRDPSLWRKIYSDPDDVEAFRLWLKLIHDATHQFVCFPDFGYASYRKEAGLFTHVFLQLYTKHNNKLYDDGGSSLSDHLNPERILPGRLIRQACFGDDFVRVLRETNHDVSADLATEIDQNQKVNVSGGESNLSFFYDRKSREIVRNRDRLLCDRLSGEFSTLLFGEQQILAMP